MNEATKGPMNKRTKGLLMNAVALITLLFFYFKGIRLFILLISGLICLAVLNVALSLSSQGTRK